MREEHRERHRGAHRWGLRLPDQKPKDGADHGRDAKELDGDGDGARHLWEDEDADEDGDDGDMTYNTTSGVVQAAKSTPNERVRILWCVSLSLSLFSCVRV